MLILRRLARSGTAPPAVVGLVALALGLAACGSPPRPHTQPPLGTAPPPAPPVAGSVADGRYLSPVVMGGLVVRPPPAGAATKHLGLTWAQAAALFRSTSAVQGIRAVAILGYGRVTLTGSALPAGTPRLDGRGAWVGIAWGGTTSCPAQMAPPPSPTVGPESQVFTAVVLYGSNGRGGIVYTSRGSPPCGGAPVGPTVAPARETLSVPWAQAGPVSAGAVRIAYRAPACATFSSMSGRGNIRGGPSTVVVEVTVPFDRSACGSTTTRTTQFRLFPTHGAPGQPPQPGQVQLLHGPTGPVAVLQAGQTAGAPT